MIIVDPLLLDGAAKTFEDLILKFADASGSDTAPIAWSPEIWSGLDTDGWTSIALPEEMDGAGGDWPTIIAIIKLAGFYRLPVPFAEHVLATRFLADAGAPPPKGSQAKGPLSNAPLSLYLNSSAAPITLSKNNGVPVLNGAASNVAWGRFASAILVIVEDGAAGKLCVIDVNGSDVETSQNIADEPRDGFTLENCDITHAPISIQNPAHYQCCAATARAAMIAGAAQKVLEITVNYTNEREQFGRPIGKFQAVQNHLAIMAEHVSAVSVAVDGAAQSLGTDREFAMAASAKIVSGRAASEVAKRAHAVIAAIGFTREFELNFLTRRLWAWRDDAGSELDWSKRLGHHVTANGGNQLWPWLTESQSG